MKMACFNLIYRVFFLYIDSKTFCTYVLVSKTNFELFRSDFVCSETILSDYTYLCYKNLKSLFVHYRLFGQGFRGSVRWLSGSC